MTHELKTWPVAFELALSGAKMFEIRVNDRNFQVGDTLHLREYELETDHYTGRELWREVTCVVTGWGLPDGMCALGVVAARAGVPEAGRAVTFDEWYKDAVMSLEIDEAFRQCWQAAQRAAPLPEAVDIRKIVKRIATDRLSGVPNIGDERYNGLIDDITNAVTPHAPLPEAENGETR